MGKEDSKYKKIRLNWNISSFVPISSNTENVQTICEVLDSKDFRNKADIQSYWSVPEKLIDIHWLANMTNDNFCCPKEDGADSFSEYIELEYNLYYIVTALGSWIGGYAKIIESLEKFQQKEDALKKYWKDNRELFVECIRQLTNSELLNHTLIMELLNPLYKAAKQMNTLPIASEQKKNLKIAAKKFCKQFEENIRYFLQEISFDEKEMLFELSLIHI